MSMTLEDTVYANQASSSYVIQPENYDAGVVLYDPLYAEYWNWLWNYLTKNLVYFNEDLNTLSEYITELETLDDTLKSNIATSSVLGRIKVEEDTSGETYPLLQDTDGSYYCDNLTSLSETISSLSETISSLSETVSSLSETVSSLSETISSLSETASSLSETVSSLSETVSSLFETVSSLSETVSSLSTTIPTTIPEVTALQVTVVDMLSKSELIGKTYYLFNTLTITGTDSVSVAGPFDTAPAYIRFYSAIDETEPDYLFSYENYTVSFENSIAVEDGDYYVYITTTSGAFYSSLFTIGVKTNVVVGATSTFFTKIYILDDYIFLFGVFPTTDSGLDNFYIQGVDSGLTTSLMDSWVIYTTSTIVLSRSVVEDYIETNIRFSITSTNIAGTQTTVSSNSYYLSQTASDEEEDDEEDDEEEDDMDENAKGELL